MLIPRSCLAPLLFRALPAAQTAVQQRQHSPPTDTGPQVLRANPLIGDLRIDGRLDEPASRVRSPVLSHRSESCFSCEFGTLPRGDQHG